MCRQIMLLVLLGLLTLQPMNCLKNQVALGRDGLSHGIHHRHRPFLSNATRRHADSAYPGHTLDEYASACINTQVSFTPLLSVSVGLGGQIDLRRDDNQLIISAHGDVGLSLGPVTAFVGGEFSATATLPDEFVRDLKSSGSAVPVEAAVKLLSDWAARYFKGAELPRKYDPLLRTSQKVRNAIHAADEEDKAKKHNQLNQRIYNDTLKWAQFLPFGRLGAFVGMMINEKNPDAVRKATLKEDLRPDTEFEGEVISVLAATFALRQNEFLQALREADPLDFDDLTKERYQKYILDHFLEHFMHMKQAAYYEDVEDADSIRKASAYNNICSNELLGKSSIKLKDYRHFRDSLPEDSDMTDYLTSLPAKVWAQGDFGVRRLVCTLADSDLFDDGESHNDWKEGGPIGDFLDLLYPNLFPTEGSSRYVEEAKQIITDFQSLSRKDILPAKISGWVSNQYFMLLTVDPKQMQKYFDEVVKIPEPESPEFLSLSVAGHFGVRFGLGGADFCSPPQIAEASAYPSWEYDRDLKKLVRTPTVHQLTMGIPHLFKTYLEHSKTGTYLEFQLSLPVSAGLAASGFVASVAPVVYKVIRAISEFVSKSFKPLRDLIADGETSFKRLGKAFTDGIVGIFAKDEDTGSMGIVQAVRDISYDDKVIGLDFGDVLTAVSQTFASFATEILANVLKKVLPVGATLKTTNHIDLGVSLVLHSEKSECNQFYVSNNHGLKLGVSADASSVGFPLNIDVSTRIGGGTRWTWADDCDKNN